MVVNSNHLNFVYCQKCKTKLVFVDSLELSVGEEQSVTVYPQGQPYCRNCGYSHSIVLPSPERKSLNAS